MYRKSTGENTEDIAFKNFDASLNPTLERDRNSVESQERESKQYALNFMKRFDKDGDGQLSDSERQAMRSQFQGGGGRQGGGGGGFGGQRPGQ